MPLEEFVHRLLAGDECPGQRSSVQQCADAFGVSGLDCFPPAAHHDLLSCHAVRPLSADSALGLPGRGPVAHEKQKSAALCPVTRVADSDSRDVCDVDAACLMSSTSLYPQITRLAPAGSAGRRPPVSGSAPGGAPRSEGSALWPSTNVPAVVRTRPCPVNWRRIPRPIR